MLRLVVRYHHSSCRLAFVRVCACVSSTLRALVAALRCAFKSVYAWASVGVDANVHSICNLIDRFRVSETFARFFVSGIYVHVYLYMYEYAMVVTLVYIVVSRLFSTKSYQCNKGYYSSNSKLVVGFKVPRLLGLLGLFGLPRWWFQGPS